MTDLLERALSDTRRRWVPDGRLGVFDVRMVPATAGGRTLAGVTTSRQALTALRQLGVELGCAVDITLLPGTGGAGCARRHRHRRARAPPFTSSDHRRAAE